MPCSELGALRDRLDDGANSNGSLNAIDAQVPLADLARGSSLDVEVAQLHDRSVLIATRDQLTSALALIELDGVARRLTLLPPDFPREHLAAIVEGAQINAIVCSEEPREQDIKVAH